MLLQASILARERLIRQYAGSKTDFDIVIVGSGVGGGVLADALAQVDKPLRILVLEAGSFLYPTHVYNICRFLNSEVAKKFGCATFWQQSDSAEDELYIGEQPQLNFGGRSIFWSGLIPLCKNGSSTSPRVCGMISSWTRGNCLDDDNEVKAPARHLSCVPEIAFHNTKLVS